MIGAKKYLMVCSKGPKVYLGKIWAKVFVRVVDAAVNVSMRGGTLLRYEYRGGGGGGGECTFQESEY